MERPRVGFPVFDFPPLTTLQRTCLIRLRKFSQHVAEVTEQHEDLFVGHVAIFSAEVVTKHQSISCGNLPVSVAFSCLSHSNSHHQRFC